MINAIKTIFERLETFKNGYLNHYYTQIAGGGYVLLDDIATLKSYITAIETPEPLTDEERKIVQKHYNSIGASSISFHDKNIGWVAHFEKGSFCPNWLATERIVGIGRTKAEAERDAYNQLKEAKLI